jgi:hypothetical protein
MKSASTQRVIAVNKRIAALGAARKLPQALEEFRRLVASAELRPTIVSYNVVLYAAIRCGELGTARAVFEQLCGASASGDVDSVQPTVVTYTTMLKGYCQQGDMRAGAGRAACCVSLTGAAALWRHGRAAACAPCLSFRRV